MANDLASARKRYELQTGIDYDSAVTGEPVRSERFEVVDDLPAESLPWLIEQALVVDLDPEPEADTDPENKPEPDPEPEATFKPDKARR